MNGDLSLSQSLGGLRIANPDDSDVKSSSPQTLAPQQTTASPQTSQSSFHNPASDNLHSPPLPLLETGGVDVASSLGFDPTAYTLNSPQPTPTSPLLHPPGLSEPSPSSDLDASNRRLGHRQSMPFNQQSHSQEFHPPQSPELRYHTSSARPTSRAFANMSPALSQSPDSYMRVRSDSAQVPGGDLRRSHSRAAAAAAMQNVSTSRNPTARPAQPSAPGLFPPRRSSRPSPTAPDPPQSLSRSATDPINPQAASDLGPPPSSEEWKDRGAALAMKSSVDKDGRQTSKIVKKGVRDFAFGRTLGEGSYSTVLAATDRQTSREYAIKVLDKRHIIKEKKVKYVNIEKDTLNRLTEHPGIVRLYYTFQDERSLYFVLDLATGGELLSVLKKTTSFDEDCSRFYGAQILDSVEYMHLRGIIHRDLKPENVLLDDQGHVKITDFGTAKILEIKGQQDQSQFGNVSVSNDPMDGADTDRAVSFVGTAEYVSPELLTDKNACKASDLWAFGCIVYQLLAGRPPFKAGNEYQTFQKIVGLEYTFPDGFPLVARDLVERLLVLDPADRLPITGIKRHRFFDGIEWGKGLWKQKPPRLRPFRPYAREASNTASRAPQDSVPPPIPKQSSAKSTQALSVSNSGQQRPQPRVITELAPPSQLDIDWSPVLNKPNERILKLGNLNVLSSPAPTSPTARSGSAADAPAETPSKFSRLFGASTTKKRQRLVMVSSAARLILAPSGGEKKEAKQVIDMRDREVYFKSQQDAKGYTIWTVFTVSAKSPGRGQRD